jgi:DNA-directed RNA polymerase specialized sigma subunit
LSLRRYSPEKYSSFEEFARSQIRSVPVSSREDAPAPAPAAEIPEASAALMGEALLALHEKLGRAPTIEEIQEYVRQQAQDPDAP